MKWFGGKAKGLEKMIYLNTPTNPAHPPACPPFLSLPVFPPQRPIMWVLHSDCLGQILASPLTSWMTGDSFQRRPLQISIWVPLAPNGADAHPWTIFMGGESNWQVHTDPITGAKGAKRVGLLAQLAQTSQARTKHFRVSHCYLCCILSQVAWFILVLPDISIKHHCAIFRYWY